MIECAAVKVKATGEVYVGRRHHQILHKRDENGELIIKDARMTAAEQGFVDDKGNFLNRSEAAKHAYECGQIFEPKHQLFSEDLY